MLKTNRTTKQQLRQEISQLRFIGQQMSNVCFNLAQDISPGRVTVNRELMDQLRREWDAIARAEGKR